MGCAPAGQACAKGAVLFGLDLISTHDNARTLMNALYDALRNKSNSDFPELELTFDQYLFGPLGVEAARATAVRSYLNECWFNADSKNAYFWEFQPIAPIFAMGVMKAIDESLRQREKPLPIDAWWIMDHPRVEAMTLVSKYQVTFLFATPRPHVKPPPPPVWGAPVNAWTTGRLGIVDLQYGER